jgi:hypothetical protein
MTKFLLLGLLLLGETPASGPDPERNWHIKSNAVKAYFLPSARSPVKFIFKAGTPVRVDEKRDRFFLVAGPNEKGGWVFRFNLIRSEEAEGREDLFSEVSGEERIAVLEAESQSAIRGRTGPDTGQSAASKLRKGIVSRYADDRRIPRETIKEVWSMETRRVPKPDLERFLSEEDLGEFSGSNE